MFNDILTPARSIAVTDRVAMTFEGEELPDTSRSLQDQGYTWFSGTVVHRAETTGGVALTVHLLEASTGDFIDGRVVFLPHHVNVWRLVD